MAFGPRYHVPFRRRRQGKTNFKRRLALLKSKKTRAVVRKSHTGISIQLVEYRADGDRVLAHGTYSDLKKLGWTYSLTDTSASYLTGLIAGKNAVKNDIEEAVYDIGLMEPAKGSRVFAVLKGLIDAGLEIPRGEKKFPTYDRISGKEKGDPNFTKAFETMRSKILEM